MWNLHNLSSKLKVRPSELVDIQESYAAFCFDQAVMYLGSYIQSELDSVKRGNGKDADKHRAAQQAALLDKLLYGEKSTTPQFKDPMSMLGGGE